MSSEIIDVSELRLRVYKQALRLLTHPKMFQHTMCSCMESIKLCKRSKKFVGLPLVWAVQFAGRRAL